MNQLQVSATLGRTIRQDQPANTSAGLSTSLGKPTRLFLDAALHAGDTAAALQWLDYLLNEHAIIRDLNCIFVWHLVRYILDRRGDAAWEWLLIESMAPWIGTTAGLKGQPAASVTVDGRNGRLRVPGAPWDFHLVEGDARYDLTLGPPESHASRWAGRRAAIESTIRAGEVEMTRQWLDQQLSEERLVHDIYGDWGWALLTVIGRRWGEEILGEVLRVTQQPWLATRYERIQQMSAEEALQLAVEGMRGHFAGPRRDGEVTVVEEPARYVMSFDACGSGGRMRRGDPVTGSGSRLEPPYNFMNVEGAYPWTWNRKGVCAYCAHCAVALQIMPIEQMGYPMRMVEYPEDPSEPCRWIIYKRPERFPDEAYIAVGKVPPKPKSS